MTMTLAQAITRTRFLLDDTDANPLVTDAEITTALEVAQEEVWRLVVTSGANVFNQQATLSSSTAGVVDLSSIKPIDVVNVAIVVGNMRTQVRPVRVFDYAHAVLAVYSLAVTYIPRVTFPTLSSDPFVWSTAAISSTTLDQLVCHIAASQCWVRTGDPPNAAIERRKDELLASIATIVSIPSWSATPLNERGTERDSGIFWVRTAHDQLQLVSGV